MTDPSRDEDAEQTPEAVEATPAEPAADKPAEAASNEDSIGETIVTSDYVSDRAFSDFPLSPEVLGQGTRGRRGN